MVKKRPAAEKALSASTLVGGMDFKANRMLSRSGGSFLEVSKLLNCRFISGKTSENRYDELVEVVEAVTFSNKKAFNSALFDFLLG